MPLADFKVAIAGALCNTGKSTLTRKREGPSTTLENAYLRKKKRGPATALAVTRRTRNISEKFRIDSETHNWFSKSANRQNNYKYLFNAINDGTDPKRIVCSYLTRWWSIQVAITRILDKYLESKTHCGITRSLKSNVGKTLYCRNSFKDEINLAYLLLLKPILADVQRVD
nr:unnamed protein product [Callosobruchus analis]